MDAGDDKVLNGFWKCLNIIEKGYATPTPRAGNARMMSIGDRQARRDPGLM